MVAIFADVSEEGFKILQINERQVFVTRNSESDGKVALLCFGEAEHDGENFWANLANIGTNRMAVLAVEVPKMNRIEVWFELRKIELLDARFDIVIKFAFECSAGKVALNVGHKNRDAGIGKTLRHHFECDGFAGAASASNQAVTVCHLWQNRQFGAVFAFTD